MSVNSNPGSNSRHCSNANITAQKMKFSIKDLFSKFDQICRKLRIISHLLKKSLMENFFFCAVYNTPGQVEDCISEDPVT